MMSDTGSSAELRKQIDEEEIELDGGAAGNMTDIESKEISEQAIELGEGSSSTKLNLDYASGKSTSSAKSTLEDLNVADEMVADPLQPSKIEKKKKTNIPQEAGSSSNALDGDEFNPNMGYMHRIAFLRACVNYMLISCNKPPIDFEQAGTGTSLSELVNMYNQLKQADDEAESD